MPFDTLPLEILHHISSHVESSDKTSLYSLLLVNKACHAAASPLCFRHIILPLLNLNSIDRLVSRREALLRDNNAFGSVRRLSIVGQVPNGESCGLSRYGVDEDEIDDLEHAIRPLYELRGRIDRASREEWDEMYKPVAGLIRRCTGLRDVLWSNGDQIAPCVLRALREALPRCRLHLTALDMESLTVDLNCPGKDVDVFEYEVATSPNLSSVIVPFVAYDGGPKVDYSREAVLHLVKKRLAPNLKTVHVFDKSYRHYWDSYQRTDRPRPPWRGFFVDQDRDEPDDTTKLSSALKHLTLWPADIANFRSWASHAILCNLRSLHLHRVDAETLVEASRLTFPSLKSLVLVFRVLYYDEDEEEDKSIAIDEAAETFVARLRPLESVHLCGNSVRHTLPTLLGRHGRTLRTLSVKSNEPTIGGWRLSPETIQLIELQCSNLRDLRLHIPRTMGDSREVAIYKAIGRIARLTRLKLKLDCFAAWGFDHEELAEVDFGDRWVSDEERAALYRRHARDILVSMAVDETLVRSIFNTIRGAHPSCSSPLQRLSVEPVLDGFPRPLPDLETTVSNMMGEWICERDPTVPPPSSREEMLAQRLIVREATPLEERNFLGLYSDPEVRDIRLGECKEAFRELWPAREWTDDSELVEVDWHSFPLATD